MEAMQWFVLGILFTLSVLGFAYASVRVKAPWYAWTVLILGALLILVGIGWAGSSWIEGVTRSSAMALTLFTGPGIIAMTLAWRYWVAPGLKTKG